MTKNLEKVCFIGAGLLLISMIYVEIRAIQDTCIKGQLNVSEICQSPRGTPMG